MSPARVGDSVSPSGTVVGPMDNSPAPDQPDQPDEPDADAAQPPAAPFATPLTAPIERHPDDLPPPGPLESPVGSRIPKGVLWALSLLVVVLVIAGWVALSNDTSKKPVASSDVVHLEDPTRQTLVPNPLLGANSMVGQPAPTTSYEKFTGGSGTLADFKGKPIVLNLWASDCTPCITEMPDFEKVHQELGDSVVFLGLDVQDRDDAAREMARRTGVTYPLGFDRNNIALQVGALGIPTTVLIDRNGTIVYQYLRAMTREELLKQVHEKLQP